MNNIKIHPKIILIRKGWALLVKEERRRALAVILVAVLSGLTSALMVGSIMPFLSVLSDPSIIHRVEILGYLYNAGKFQTDYGFLVSLGLISLITIIVANLIQILRLYLVTDFATMRMHTLSTRLLSVYLRHPYEYFLNKNSSELGSQILAETQKAVQTFFQPVAEAIAASFTIIAIVLLLIWVNPLVAAVALISAGGLYFGAHAMSRKLVRQFGSLRAAANRKRYRLANEALTGIKDVKLLAREDSYVASYSSESLSMATAESRALFIGQLPQYVMQIVAFGGMIALVFALLEPTSLSDGSTMNSLLPLLGVFALGGQRLIPELSRLYFAITQITYGESIVDALHFELQGEQTLPPLPPFHTAAMGLKQHLELRNVTYVYPNADIDGLTGASVKIRAGERIGIVGESGAGKTTLADVVMGLLRPSHGQIIVDDTMVVEDNYLAWQRSVGYVQQEIFLSDASIMENIALGIPENKIDRDRVMAAARMAQLDDFVTQNLPAGYDTSIGERGVRLSGGQRQRIGIARALYNEADLIVFDEATSALDNITERQVMDSIDALSGKKTVILIAHRLSTLEKCDRLIVVEHGRVTGIGTWDELLSNNEHFQKLASAALEPIAVRT